MISLTRPSCPNSEALRNGNYKVPSNKKSLRESSHDKCMYCESIVSHTYFGDIEHIVPKSIRPDLEFEWDNLGFACALCNGNKSNKYDDSLSIINPYLENPSDFLTASGAVIYPVQGNSKGELTILTVDLNRLELIQRRQDLIYRISRAISACFNSPHKLLMDDALDTLRTEANDDKEYSFVIRKFLELHSL